MEIKVKEGIKKPHRIPAWVYWRVRDAKRNIDRYLKRRITFDYGDVVGGVSNEAEFSAILFRDIQYLKEALKGVKANRSLEIGCGYGRLTPFIAEYSNEHFAIDPESKLLKVAGELYPTVKFFHAYAQDLPFPDNYFDLCVIWTVLQHVPPELINKAIEEIKMVTKANGVIILAEETECGGSFPFVFGRSIEEYERLLRPWHLVWKTERQLIWKSEGVRERNKSAGIVMRFEMRGDT